LLAEADPQRLKPGLFCGTYGAAEAAPLSKQNQNQKPEFFRKLFKPRPFKSKI
jgi:hypothetical protein